MAVWNKYPRRWLGMKLIFICQPVRFCNKPVSLAQNLESYILSQEPREFTQKLEEWLPIKGNWSICWQATMDGWESTAFHSNCDGKIPTLTVVKVVQNNKIYVFGGYSTVTWAVSSKNLIIMLSYNVIQGYISIF